MKTTSSLVTNMIVAMILAVACGSASPGIPDAAARLRALKNSQPARVTWTTEEAVAATPAPAAPKLILVTESWCGPCQSLKRNLKKEGIEYRTISISQARSEYNRTVKSIPYMFYVRKDGTRVGNYGVLSGSKLREFAAPTRSLSAASAAPGRKERRICRIRANRTGKAILEALATHLAVAKGADEPVGGLADINVPVSTKITDILVIVSHKQELSIGRFLTATWKDLSITSSNGRTTFVSPVTITGRALGISLTATLKSVYLHEDGRTVDVEVDGFPDLRIVFN